jgi:ribonuclease HII
MLFKAKNRKVKITKLIIHSYQRRIEKLYIERKRIYNLYNYENRLKNEGYFLIAGIDEAGRGSLSGPVVAAAVILPCQLFIPYIKDSKKLTSKKRTELYFSILYCPSFFFSNEKSYFRFKRSTGLLISRWL